MRWVLPGPQLPAHTASRPVSCASAAAAKAPTSSLRTCPLHALRAADGIDERIETVTDDAVDAPDAGALQNLDQLFGHGAHSPLLARSARPPRFSPAIPPSSRGFSSNRRDAKAVRVGYQETQGAGESTPLPEQASGTST
jgi:hypothetical protein